ncbi:hypothetical protein, partial [Yersinia rohdei]|uniref:hypothetical protein n=1 Tax=Yersinia rohdei TaxID=29485 RepID=UPI001C96AF8B
MMDSSQGLACTVTAFYFTCSNAVILLITHLRNQMGKDTHTAQFLADNSHIKLEAIVLPIGTLER